MINGQGKRRAALLAALKRLPLVRPDANLDASVDALQLGCFFAGVNELPRMSSSRKKNGAAVELEKFERLALKLRRHLNSMSLDGINALARDGQRHALAVDDDLERMIRNAVECRENAEPVQASTSPKRLQPEQIAQICAQLYPTLTGKKAGVHWNDIAQESGGPFLRFVSEVFAACGLRASAEHYARTAARHVGAIGGSGGVVFSRMDARKSE